MFRSLPAALCLLATTLGLARGFSGAQDAPVVLQFDHAQHVNPGWSSQAAAQDPTLTSRMGETLRDCRGCHEYDPQRESFKPSDRCQRCHDPDRYWQNDPETRQSIDTSKAKVDPKDEAGGGFQHSHHLVHGDTGTPIDCAQCHYRNAEKGSKVPWRIVLPSAVAGATNYCITCHSKGPAELRQRFNAGLNKDLERRAQRGGPAAAPVFSHAAHLRPEELAGGNLDTCAKCHAHVAQAGADTLAEYAFDTASCEGCHTGMRFEAALKLESGQPIQEESPTRRVFSHAQHLGPGKGLSGVAPIGPRGCLACHEFERGAAAASPVPTFGLRPSLRSTAGRGAFHGCVECHASWKNEDHGKVDTCAQCHALESGSLASEGAKVSNRPRDPVARVDAASFTFGRQSHVFIAKGRTAGAPDNCAKCHRAELAELASRIEKRPFRHATHLAMGAGAGVAALSDAACVQCHQAVADAPSLEKLATTFDLGACDRCHGSTPPTPIPEEHPRTSAFRFDHTRHVGRRGPDGKPIACVDCHLVSGPGEPDRISLDEKISDCRTCHRHPAEAEKGINRFSRELVQSCVVCHVSGVPAKGEVVLAPRAHLAARRDGYQRHEGTQACSSCHIEGGSDSGAFAAPDERPPSTEIAITTRSARGVMRTPHRARREQGAKADVPGADLQAGIYFQERVSCAECHWSKLDRCPDTRVKDAALHPAAPDWVKQRLGAKNWQRAARESAGKDLGGPGTNYPEGFPGVVPAH